MKKLKSILNKKALVAALALTGFTSSGFGGTVVNLVYQDSTDTTKYYGFNAANAADQTANTRLNLVELISLLTGPVNAELTTKYTTRQAAIDAFRSALQTTLVAMLNDPITYSTLPQSLLSSIYSAQSNLSHLPPIPLSKKSLMALFVKAWNSMANTVTQETAAAMANWLPGGVNAPTAVVGSTTTTAVLSAANMQISYSPSLGLTKADGTTVLATTDLVSLIYNLYKAGASTYAKLTNRAGAEVIRGTGALSLGGGNITAAAINTAFTGVLNDYLASFIPLQNDVLASINAQKSSNSAVQLYDRFLLSADATNDQYTPTGAGAAINHTSLSRAVLDALTNASTVRGFSLTASLKDAYFLVAQSFGSQGSATFADFKAAMLVCQDSNYVGAASGKIDDATYGQSIQNAIQAEMNKYADFQTFSMPATAISTAFENAVTALNADSALGFTIPVSVCRNFEQIAPLAVGTTVSISSLVNTLLSPLFSGNYFTAALGTAAYVSLDGPTTGALMYYFARELSKLYTGSVAPLNYTVTATATISLGKFATTGSPSATNATAINSTTSTFRTATASGMNNLQAALEKWYAYLIGSGVTVSGNTKTFAGDTTTPNSAFGTNEQWTVLGAAVKAILPAGITISYDLPSGSYNSGLPQIITNFFALPEIVALNLNSNTKNSVLNSIPVGLTTSVMNIIACINDVALTDTSSAALSGSKANFFRQRFGQYLVQQIYSSVSSVTEAALAAKVNSGSADLKEALDAVYAPVSGSANYVAKPAGTDAYVLKSGLDGAVSGLVTQVAVSGGTAASAVRNALDTIYAPKPATGSVYVTDTPTAGATTVSLNEATLKGKLDAIYAKTADLQAYGLSSLGCINSTGKVMIDANGKPSATGGRNSSAQSGLDRDMADVMDNNTVVSNGTVVTLGSLTWNNWNKNYSKGAQASDLVAEDRQ